MTRCLLFLIVLQFCAATALMAAGPVEVEIEGLEGDALENVRSALTVPPGLVQEGVVNEPWLERFARQAEEKVLDAVKPFGYYHAGVSTSLEKKEERFVLRVVVTPGEPIRITNVTVSLEGPGAEEQSLSSLASGFPLRPGDVLLQTVYEEEKGRLRSLALDLGYLDAEFVVQEIRISLHASTAEIELRLATGPQYRFGEVSFPEATDYPEEFLRRYLAFRPGGVFSHAKLGKTQLNYINSDRFREVIVSPEKEKALDFRVPVSVRLQPAPRRRLRPGIGYGTDTGARLSVRYRDMNMFRRGHELKAELNLSEKVQGLAAGYIIPGRKSLESFTELQLNLQREHVSDYETQLFSFEINRTRSFRRGRLGSVYLRLVQEEFSAGAEKSDSLLVVPGIRYSERRYDDLVRPKRGYSYSFELRGTHEYLGSDTGFLQAVADGSAVISLPWRLLLYGRLKGAATVQNEKPRDIPVSFRFFAGGDRSVRGYAYQELGPRDVTGDVVGGKHLLVGSVEVERSLFGSWGVAAFYDAGNAFNSVSDISLRQGAGLGVRYYTRVGAVRIDLARQIGVRDPGFRLHLSVGFGL